MGLTEGLADRIFKTDFSDIPDSAVRQAKAGIMDWIFVTLAGRWIEENAVRNMEDLLISKGGSRESSILGSKKKLTETQAAMLNGFAGHILDYDETCPKVRSHLFAAIFPALLAVAEHEGISGKEMLTGFITGHETAMRIGEAMTPEWMKAGWHGTSLFGVFGATAGCAKILRLDTDRIRTAIGLASSMASGLSINFGSLAKPLHAGMASERGIMCARLAANGITANSVALESELGFFHAYNWGQKIHDKAFGSFGSPWGLETPGMSSIKLYPCCHGVATNIECGRRMHDKYGPSLDEVTEIEIHSQPKALCSMLSKVYDDNGESIEWGYDGPPRKIKTLFPVTGPQGKFSKEYVFSRAIMEGNVRLEHFTDKAVNDPQVRKWMDKIKVFHNSELERYSNQYPEETAPHAERMIVRLRDGKIIEEEEIFILGMTKRPLSFEDVVSKYHDCGNVAGLSGEKIDRIMSLTGNLDKLENISELLNFLV
ncbi:MAG: MmgE/PrpD family protein [Deltaproteobacteria bacterium]|nr:MmgE/PrpD family protein [Deltaproteobacteria bacterium]